MSSAAETIKERLGIVEVLESYMKIEKAGANYKARCPFHHEKTPSFFISPARNSYYCFGCGAKGDIFTFVQEFEKVDFVGALKILAERAGIELEQFKDERKGEYDRLRGVLELSTTFFQKQLEQNKKALEYLMGRGLTKKTIRDWRLGYAPNDWRKLYDFLKSKKVSEADMETVGLVKRSEKSDGTMYDRFRARVMFPIFDPSSRVVGYSGRIFGVPDSEGPKYLNSPDTPLFNKSEILYGYHKAKEGIRQWKYTILVEGQMDLLLCHQNGYTNAVATSGTSLTPGHLDKLKKISDNLMLVYDADKAGLKATLRAWTGALQLSMDVKVAGLPDGDDPASLLLKNKDEFKKALQNSKNIIEYYLDIVVREHKTPDKLKMAVQGEVLPYVVAVESAIFRSELISRISLKTGILIEDLREELHKLLKEKDKILEKFVGSSEKEYVQKDREADVQDEIALLKRDPIQRRIVGLLLWLHSLGDTVKSGKKASEYEKLILDEMGTFLEETDIEVYKKALQKGSEDMVYEAELLFQGSEKIQTEIDELLQSLEEKYLKDKLVRAMHDLHLSETKKDTKRAEELIQLCQDISNKLSLLNKKKKN
ncbi:MAG: DNA primase [Candidatus Taylorbacteria bacterium]|nr:DNA primase [Candidatus Taylorbacteria bacterium]